MSGLVLQPSVYAPGLSRHPPFAHDTLHVDRADLMRRPCQAAGCGRVYTEKASGAQRDRPELKAALDYAREGDTLAGIIHLGE